MMRLLDYVATAIVLMLSAAGALLAWRLGAPAHIALAVGSFLVAGLTALAWGALVLWDLVVKLWTVDGEAPSPPRRPIARGEIETGRWRARQIEEVLRAARGDGPRPAA